MVSRIPFKQRVQHAENSVSRELFELMHEKKTNLALSADYTHKHDLLNLVESVGAEICVLKTHIDIIEDFDTALIEELQHLAQQHRFIIFEDRKFADIGNTVKHQYADGIYHIADWAKITNAHIVPGPGIIEGLKTVGMSKGNGLLLLAQMSSTGTTAKGEYTQENVTLAMQHKDFVMGFICQQRLTDDPGFIHMTPGVKLDQGGDSLGQQYLTPQKVIRDNGSDVVIVGRGIYQADDPVAAAKKYREAAWSSLGVY
ncbi:MAG: orotidine-5'-phosphate decarboxylase [Gammaproteobacteria bacterium]|nr:orotidine-5'-phosphate decarboxylase [Gammaproteobacteria bacterium]MCH9744755.1 orotidine-5'-phosphate decarboxylase [Gammaproteobacteria bacterium]